MPEQVGKPWLCPLCDLLHKHVVELVRTPGQRPEVECPCPRCKSNNMKWDTEGEYLEWVRRRLPQIEMEAERVTGAEGIMRASDDEQETDGDVEHQRKMEELEDERRWELAKQKSEGTGRPVSAWGKHAPPD